VYGTNGISNLQITLSFKKILYFFSSLYKNTHEMQSKREIKQNEENRKLAAFCRYIRKNPDLFSEHNLHQLMLDDQNKKGKPLDSEKECEKPEEPIEIVIDKGEKKPEEKLLELPAKLDEIPPGPELEEFNKVLEEKKKEKKPRKPRKKKEDKRESAPEPPDLNLKDLPENPPLLERQSGVKDLEPEKKQLEPGPVDEMKSSGN
jgi:hypothetical protein